jgi:16S rRNA (cytosine1402-N4)-methyltransferase
MTVHVPILVGPIVDALVEPFRALPAEAPAHWLVDCTLGGGGHSRALLDALAGSRHKLLSVDQDPGAVERGRAAFAREIAEGRMEIVHSRFGALDLGGREVLGLMADLGFSSDQLEDAERGLSFQWEGPLDMRLDPTRGQSALEFLRSAREDEIARVLFEYGEERLSRKIAAAIASRRRDGKLPTTTKELAELIVAAVPPGARHGRIHAATRSFQGLRIHVNDELGELDALLKNVIRAVKPGGRVAIISFHSLEDREVKRVFKDREGEFRQLTKKPIEADEEECRRNPRSRSAKLRIAERT